jgi:hypothetical protein
MLAEDDGSYRLIGIQGSTLGLDTTSEIGKKGLRWDKAQSSISLIPPVGIKEPGRFCIATRTEVWQHLLETDPIHTVVQVYYKTRPTGANGSLDLYLRMLSLDGSHISTKLLKRGILTSKSGAVEDIIFIQYADLNLDQNVPPAHIVGATVVWAPTTAAAFVVDPDVEARDAAQKAIDPVRTSSESHVLEALGVTVGRRFEVGQKSDFREIARTSLFHKIFAVPASSTSNVAVRSDIVRVAFESELNH